MGDPHRIPTTGPAPAVVVILGSKTQMEDIYLSACVARSGSQLNKYICKFFFFLGAGTVVQHIKPLPLMPASRMKISLSPSCSTLDCATANVPGKEPDDGPTTWAHGILLEDPDEVPGFSLGQSWPLPIGE